MIVGDSNRAFHNISYIIVSPCIISYQGMEKNTCPMYFIPHSEGSFARASVSLVQTHPVAMLKNQQSTTSHSLSASAIPSYMDVLQIEVKSRIFPWFSIVLTHGFPNLLTLPHPIQRFDRTWNCNSSAKPPIAAGMVMANKRRQRSATKISCGTQGSSCWLWTSKKKTADPT